MAALLICPVARPDPPKRMGWTLFAHLSTIMYIASASASGQYLQDIITQAKRSEHAPTLLKSGVHAECSYAWEAVQIAATHHDCR